MHRSRTYPQWARQFVCDRHSHESNEVARSISQGGFIALPHTFHDVASIHTCHHEHNKFMLGKRGSQRFDSDFYGFLSRCARLWLPRVALRWLVVVPTDSAPKKEEVHPRKLSPVIFCLPFCNCSAPVGSRGCRASPSPPAHNGEHKARSPA